MEGCMVDALALESDERREMAAISFDEVPINLWLGDLWMGKPYRRWPVTGVYRSVPREVKHLSTWRNRKQYMEISFWADALHRLIMSMVLSAITLKKKFLAIPWVAASETGPAQTIVVYNNGVVGRSLHLVAQSYKARI